MIVWQFLHCFFFLFGVGDFTPLAVAVILFFLRYDRDVRRHECILALRFITEDLDINTDLRGSVRSTFRASMVTLFSQLILAQLRRQSNS